MLRTAPLALALCLAVSPLVAQGSIDSRPTSDPAAVAVVEAALDQLIADQRLSFESSTEHNIKGPHFHHESSSSMSVWREGDAFAVRPLGSQGTVEAVSDGELLWLHLRSSGRYTEGPAPATFNDIALVEMVTNENPLLLAIMNPQATKSQLHQAVITHEGQEDVAGQITDRVRVALSAEALEALAGVPMPADMGFDAWITVGKPHRLLRVEPTIQALFDANPGRFPAGTQASVTTTFHDWKTPEGFEPDTFVFTPPEGAEQVEDLTAAPTVPGGPKDVLLHRPAPDFELPALEGGDVALADLNGQIVILDFWATWCGPCVQGLPQLYSTANDYGDHGVVFYAINAAEDPDTIRQFLSREGLDDLDVLIDSGEVAQAFHVSGIPQTVVIDRDGVVRAVHVGFGPDSNERLANDLNEILAAEMPAE